MSSKSAEQKFYTQGVAGNAEGVFRVYNASSGDTVDFGQWFTKVNQAALLGISGAAPNIGSIASTAIASLTVLTLPTSPSFHADDFDIVVIGPGVQGAGG